MKYFFFLLLLSTFGYAQERVALENIAQYEGKTVTICEKVQSTFFSKNNKNTMLNFGKPYPNQTFVIAIFEKDFPLSKHVGLKPILACHVWTYIWLLRLRVSSCFLLLSTHIAAVDRWNALFHNVFFITFAWTNRSWETKILKMFRKYLHYLHLRSKSLLINTFASV